MARSSRPCRHPGDDRRPTRSELEDVLLDLVLRGGLAHLDVNLPMTYEGRRIVPDFRWPEQRLIVEPDGAAWHDHRLAREDDGERQALLERHGERVVRVTWGKPSGARADPRRLRAAGAPSAADKRDVASGAPPPPRRHPAAPRPPSQRASDSPTNAS